MDYRFEMLEKAKEIINGLSEAELKRITIDLEDEHPEVTGIFISIELDKDYSLDYNQKLD